MRPYCVDFLRFCFKRFHVGLWSSAREKNLQGILTKAMGDLKNKLLFTWDQKHCTDSGFTCLEKRDKPLFFKELSHLWDKKYPNLPWSEGEFSASNTLLITNPAKALLNPPNTAIFLPGYDPENRRDNLLGPKGELRVFLNGTCKVMWKVTRSAILRLCLLIRTGTITARSFVLLTRKELVTTLN
ncbi:uncharacterized protein LOC143619484 [Bidens hawaiensis]|uniref:uncharacterized protein LOC143619484 n=1 Tax=Bidens hawaiensis TaxID=980011 RepID=UPI004049C2AC